MIGDSGSQLIPHNGFSGSYMIEIDAGVIEKFRFENFIFHFRYVKGVGGIHIKAQIDSSNIHGGNWNSVFRNIKMKEMKGHGIYIEGGANADFKLFDQYLLFENVQIIRDNEEANCLKITGGVVNCTFLRCDFEVTFGAEIDGTNVYLGTTSLVEFPSGISFINCATGGTRYGYRVTNSQNIRLDNCWFEQTDIAIDVVDSSAIDIINCRFANAAAMGTAKINNNKDLINSYILDEDPNALGRCIGALNSSVNIKDNYVAVTDYGGDIEDPLYAEVMVRLAHSRFILSVDKNALNVEDNFFQHIRLNATYGITQYDNIKMVSNYYYNSPSDVSGIDLDLDIKGRKIILLTETDPPNELKTIHRINSTINAGEFLTIRAEGQKIEILEWDPENETDGKNIYHSGKGTLTLPPGAIAHYLKADGINNQEWCSYQLISTTGYF